MVHSNAGFGRLVDISPIGKFFATGEIWRVPATLPPYGPRLALTIGANPEMTQAG
jgi:hypothetical protein